MSNMKKFAYITYLSNDRDYKGALLLNYNLKKYNHRYRLGCIVLEGVSDKIKNILKHNGILLHYFSLKDTLKEFNTDDTYSDFLINKHYYGKYLIFKLVEYEKIVYLDTDLLIKKNIDNLFEYNTEKNIYMTYDMAINNNNLYFKRQMFNSGVIVLSSNIETYMNCYRTLVEENKKILSQDATDQTIFNLMNKRNVISIEYLNFKYNYLSCLPSIKDIVESDIAIVHFILQPKPWNIVDFDIVQNSKIYSDPKIFFSEWLDLYFSMTKELLENMTSYNRYHKFNKKYIVNESSSESDKIEIFKL